MIKPPQENTGQPVDAHSNLDDAVGSAPSDRGRTLIAGVGNIFLSDDGFGVEVVRRLRSHEMPAGVDLAETGVRGVDLAYRLLDGYDACILVDACARGGQPGTLYRIDTQDARAECAAQPAFDGHRMTPDAVLGLLETLSAGTGERPPRTIEVVGCEPADVEEGIGLSEAVEAAVPHAVRLILRILHDRGAGSTRATDDMHSTGSAHSAPAPLEMGAR